MIIRKPGEYSPSEITPQGAYHRDARRRVLGTLASAAGLANGYADQVAHLYGADLHTLR